MTLLFTMKQVAAKSLIGTKFYVKYVTILSYLYVYLFEYVLIIRLIKKVHAKILVKKNKIKLYNIFYIFLKRKIVFCKNFLMEERK
jgi:hypothetical protein